MVDVQTPRPTVTSDLVLVVDDVSVTYDVYEDQRHRSLKGVITRGLRRPKPRRVEAVRSASFELREGETLGLIGSNGSGKSSLLRAVAGLMPTRSGRIHARSEPVLLGVGAALHPELSARRNVFLGGTALGMSRAEVEAKFDDIVDFAEVRDFIDMPLRTFSSGMNSRLRFAIAAAGDPDILLIDEALAVGDESFKAKSQARMRQMASQAGALVLVSHSLGSISEMCERAIWLEKGEIRHRGDTDEVIAAYQAHVRG